MPLPLLKCFATPLLALFVGEENLVIGFGPPTLEMLPPSLALSATKVEQYTALGRPFAPSGFTSEFFFFDENLVWYRFLYMNASERQR